MSTDINFSGSVPQIYDTHLGPILFEPYAKNLVQRIKEQDLHKVLELACGTGRATNHLLKKIPSQGKLIATDFNPEMIAVANLKIIDERVIWKKVDAQNLPFGEKEFDLVVCQFGVMFFDEKLKAFKEAYRVLNDAGMFLFNTWDNVKTNLLSHLTQQVLVEIIKADPPDFLEKGPYSFYDQEEIKQLLKQAGFKKVGISIVKKQTESTDIESIVKGILEGSPLTNYLKKINAPQKQIHERLKQLIIEKGSTKLPMQAIVCEAIK